MATTTDKRWILSWGYDDGTIRYIYTTRPLRAMEAEVSALDSDATARHHFDGAAIERRQADGKSLRLSELDQSYWQVNGSIERYEQSQGYQHPVHY